MSGIVGANPDLIGATYEDRHGNSHLPISRHPVIVLTAATNVLRNIRNRARGRGVETATYIEERLSTGHDAANRAVFAKHGPDDGNTVGIALRAEKKIVEKITKGAKMHE